MRIHSLVLASSVLALFAAPAVALTVQSAPPKPEIAQRLAARDAGPRLEDTFAGAGRPEPGVRFGGPTATYGATTFGFGPVRTTIRNEPADPRRLDRRDAHAPLLLSPPRR